MYLCKYTGGGDIMKRFLLLILLLHMSTLWAYSISDHRKLADLQYELKQDHTYVYDIDKHGVHHYIEWPVVYAEGPFWSDCEEFALRGQHLAKKRYDIDLELRFVVTETGENHLIACTADDKICIDNRTVGTKPNKYELMR